MKLFKDSSLREEIQELDLGEVFAGQKKEYRFFIFNNNGTDVKDIKISIEHNEIKLISYPTKLKDKEHGSVIFEWTPSLTIKKGLKAQIQISCIEVWSNY